MRWRAPLLAAAILALVLLVEVSGAAPFNQRVRRRHGHSGQRENARAAQHEARLPAHAHTLEPDVHVGRRALVSSQTVQTMVTSRVTNVNPTHSMPRARQLRAIVGSASGEEEDGVKLYNQFYDNQDFADALARVAIDNRVVVSLASSGCVVRL